MTDASGAREAAPEVDVIPDLDALAALTLRAASTTARDAKFASDQDVIARRVEEVLAVERRTLSAQCRADPECINGLLADDFHEYGASGGSITRDGIAERVAAATTSPTQLIGVEDLRGQWIADGIVMVKYTATNQDRRTHRTSLWRRTEAGDWLMFHHQGTIAASQEYIVWMFGLGLVIVARAIQPARLRIGRGGQ